jgi:hypothetical protein
VDRRRVLGDLTEQFTFGFGFDLVSAFESQIATTNALHCLHPFY